VVTLTRTITICWIALAATAWSMPGQAADRFITLASTTSTENSGLFEHMLPQFEAETGIAVRVIAVGTGQAMRLGQNGDADLLLVHHRPSEERFVAEGYGKVRYDVMYNDFIVVGPSADPAGITGFDSVAGAFGRIAVTQATFASRGDDSGTNKAEIGIWGQAGVDPTGASGDWYRELGAGMGATLNTASAMQAYTLTDRATWLAFENPGELTILVEGDPVLFNQYGVIPINVDRHPHVKYEDAGRLVDWLLSPAGQGAIAAFRLRDTQVFFPNAGAG